MEMIYSTEIRGWTVAATTSKIELNGARREVEALVEINFSFLFFYFFDIFFSICLTRIGAPQNFSSNGYKMWPMEILQRL